MAEEEADFSFTPEGWADMWRRGYIGFHLKIVNPVIKEFLPQLSGGKTNQKIFVPLCGKTLDMKWIADQGHRVVGVDCVHQAAKEFFEENKISFTITDVPSVEKCQLYKSTDEKIEFYVCDFFALKSDLIGQFDAVWDCGSIFAIAGYDEKDRYVEHMKSFVKDGARILLDLAEPKLKPGEKAPDWDESLYEADVKRMFSKHECYFLILELVENFFHPDWCSSIEQVQTYDYANINQHLTKDPSNAGDGSDFDAWGKVYLIIK